ncbi:hypothetical protein C1646_696493 [Rhizophagus diaphanus]|nr:hypothetical protein C1646_696493 [Rhizophagus diaphanus] [Rhizophagus sp. MUCL 43196]
MTVPELVAVIETKFSNSVNASLDSKVLCNALAIAPANKLPPTPEAIIPTVPKPAAPIDCKIATRLPAATVP